VSCTGRHWLLKPEARCSPSLWSSFYANADRAGALIGANVNGQLANSTSVQIRGSGNYGDPYVMTFSANAGDTIEVWMYSPATPGSAMIDDVSLTRQ
jgi:hypothetical protein